MEKDYFRYEITNELFKTIGGADSIKEARKIVKENLRDDHETYGFNTTRDSYHIFRLNRYTGKRLTEVK